MNLERMEKAHAYLIEVARKKEEKKAPTRAFNMGTWGKSLSESFGPQCTTKCCALGELALSGIFKKDGLYTRVEEQTADPALDPDEPSRWWELRILLKSADQHILWDYRAAAELFDINVDQCHYLFDPEKYHDHPSTGLSGLLEVARRFQQFIVCEQNARLRSI